MLIIEENVDLEKVKNFGFVEIGNCYVFSISCIVINKSTRTIEFYGELDYDTIEIYNDVLFDLIQNGIITKKKQ